MRRIEKVCLFAVVVVSGMARAQTIAQCDTWYNEWRTSCPSLTQPTRCESLEKSLFQCNTHNQPHTTVAMPAVMSGQPDGTLQSGVRQLYDQSTIKLTVSDGSYFSSLNGARLGARSALAPINPSYESDTPSINSCREYAYKKYYQASRIVDALTAFHDDYTGAVDLILFGASVVGARTLPALPGASLTDFDGHPLVDKNGNQTGIFAPTAITSTMNAFRTMGRNEFMKSVVSYADANTLALAQAAAAPVAINTDDWSYARLMRSNADVAALSPSESDSIASRVSAFSRAMSIFDSQFGPCIGQSWAMQVGSTANDGTLAQRLANVVQQAVGGGYTDPTEMQMFNSLANATTRPATLQKLASAEATGVMPDLITARYYYNTRSGSTIARMAYLNATALGSTFDGFASGNLQGPACGPASAALGTATDLLVAEYNRADHGCLGTHADGSVNQKCEWSAPLFVRDTTARVRAAESNADHLHQDCVDLYGETWQIAAPVAPDRTTLTSFDSSLASYKAQLISEDKNAPHSSYKWADGIGQHDHKEGTWGDGRFGASYSYDFDWGVHTALPLGPDGAPCQVDGAVGAKLNVQAMVEGSNSTILDGEVSATSDASGGTFHINLTVLDEAVYAPADHNLANAYSDRRMSHHKQSLVDETILIVFIPVTIDAGVSFDYGFALNASLNRGACVQDKPSLSLTTTAGPQAGVSAYLSASVDAFIASVGVECDLTLVEVDLPATIGATVGPDPSNNNTWTVTVTTSLDLLLKELSGKLSMVVKVFGIDVYDESLFKWDGLAQKFHVWRDQWKYPLQVLTANGL